MRSYPGEVITFYSYKGGTGRSMALANVAAYLAKKGRRTLMIDWDLEAPGLPRYFQAWLESEGGFGNAVTRPGLLDLFSSLSETLDRGWSFDPDDEEEATTKLFRHLDIEGYILNTDVDGLYLMHAGIQDEMYPSRVNTFDWEHTYERFPQLFQGFAEALTEEFDYVLVDSRTGITDTSGICTMLLPEKLVVVFTPNRQSLTGVVDLVRRATAFRRESNDLRPLVVFPLASRVDVSEEILKSQWRFGEAALEIRGYEAVFEELLEEVYDLPGCTLTSYFDEVQIQHQSSHAYGERVSVLDRLQDRLSLARSYGSLAENLVELRGPWEHHVGGSDPYEASGPDMYSEAPYPPASSFHTSDLGYATDPSSPVMNLLMKVLRYGIEPFLWLVAGIFVLSSLWVLGMVVGRIELDHQIATSQQEAAIISVVYLIFAGFAGGLAYLSRRFRMRRDRARPARRGLGDF